MIKAFDLIVVKAEILLPQGTSVSVRCYGSCSFCDLLFKEFNTERHNFVEFNAERPKPLEFWQLLSILLKILEINI